MRIFKYRIFEKWAKKQGINNADLKKAISEIESGLVDASLGGHIYKKRIGINGQGKRSSHRTIIFMKVNDKAIFAHGFSKGEKSNITKQELDEFKTMSALFLNLNNEKIDLLISNKSLIEVL